MYVLWTAPVSGIKIDWLIDIIILEKVGQIDIIILEKLGQIDKLFEFHPRTDRSQGFSNHLISLKIQLASKNGKNNYLLLSIQKQLLLYYYYYDYY